MKASQREELVSRPNSDAAARGMALLLGTWLKANGFILGLFAVVLLAFIFPDPAARNGWLHPDLVQNIGIALILFLQGISMPLEKVKKGAGNWKLHVTIQSFTFLIFPVVGLAFAFVLRAIWPNEPPAVRDGFLYLCVLPSTVSTSVVLTSVAGGNTAAAILSAAFFEYRRCDPDSCPGQPAHACDRKNRVRLAWPPVTGYYHADPIAVRGRGRTSLVCSSMGGRQ
jgi:hypothetical protein